MSCLNSWPILSFIPSSLATKVKKAFVFGGAGNEALLSLTNGDVYALGFNGNGCLGVGDGSSTLEPKIIEQLCQKDIVQLAYGMGPHVLAVTDSGELYSWGHGGYGQLGHTSEEKSKPVLVYMQKKVIQVACGSYHSIALTEDGEVYAWGSNNCGQLGLGISNNQATPKRVSLIPSKKIVSVSCGQSFTVMLTTDGELYSWGYNGNGQLGIENNTNQLQPVRVTGSLIGKFIEKIVCGMAHVLVLTDIGELYSWGANSYGQLGLGTTHNTSVPTLINTTTDDRWSDIAAHHYNHISAGVTISGKIYMWGHCHGLTILSPREVAVNNLDGVFSCFGMPQIMYKFIDIDHEENQTIKEAIAKSFNESETSDITFLVDGKEIHAHKSILKIRCHYFRNMLHSNWKESDKREIEVAQFSYNVYEAFIRYLYTDFVDLPPHDAIALLDLADAYCEIRLKKQCENMIKKGISIENAAMLLETSIKYSAKSLEDYCFRFALNHLTAVTQTEAFRNLDGETVKAFIIKAGLSGAFKR
ncbi:RCC1 and BTB domain-containing protein 1 isoform X3 [Hydra vulgaris]|uniref:RCC1 and BTB domain-containing protein 1 isoform X3 n=1 Tax=Hydra vulgaris TaxID=6087 RepID=A0ABM4B5P9_HYDVU